MKRNRYDRLLARTVAGKQEAAALRKVERPTLAPETQSDIETSPAQQARFAEIAVRFDEIARTVGEPLEELAEHHDQTEVFSHAMYIETLNAVIESIGEMRELLEEANGFTALAREDMLQRDDLFRTYMRAVMVLETDAALFVEANEYERDPDEREPGITRLLSSSALAYLDAAQAELPQEEAVQANEVSVLQAMHDYDVRVPAWVADVANRLLIEFRRIQEFPRNIDACVDEIYEDLAHRPNLASSALALARASEYMLVRVARLANADPTKAAEERVQLSHALEALAEWWGRELPEVAVKYHALLQYMDDICSVIQASDMYAAQRRQEDVLEDRLRASRVDDSVLTQAATYDA